MGELCPVSLIFSFELSHPALRCKAGCPHRATVSFLFSPKGNGRFYRNESHISYRILLFRKERHIKFYHFGEYCGLNNITQTYAYTSLWRCLNKGNASRVSVIPDRSPNDRPCGGALRYEQSCQNIAVFLRHTRKRAC